MGDMRIGRLAERAGVTTRTVRYYESLGLLPEAERSGAHRTYGEADVERLRRIDLLKRLGLSLDEVAEVISAYADESPRAKRRVADVLRRHLEETDAKIAELKAFRKDLLFRVDLVEAYAEREERSRRRR